MCAGHAECELYSGGRAGCALTLLLLSPSVSPLLVLLLLLLAV